MNSGTDLKKKNLLLYNFRNGMSERVKIMVWLIRVSVLAFKVSYKLNGRR